jgi:hypothetical protein
MDSKQFANVLGQLLPKVNMPAAPENIQAVAEVYKILGALASGELILSPPAKSVPEA